MVLTWQQDIYNLSSAQQLHGWMKALDHIDLLLQFPNFSTVYTLCCCIGSLVFLSTNALQSLHELAKSITLDCMLWKKKCVQRHLSMLLIPEWLHLCASLSAFFYSASGNIILSDFSRILFPEIVILSRIGSNFRNLFDADLGIHFLPDLTIFSNCESMWSSSVHSAINDIPRWSMTGVVCNKESRLCSS